MPSWGPASATSPPRGPAADRQALVAVLDPEVVVRSERGVAGRGVEAVARLSFAGAQRAGGARPVLVNGLRGIVGYHTDAECGALLLAEAATRLADHPDAVTDEIWAEVAPHYDEKALGAIVLMVAVTNMFNRINTTLRVPAASARQQTAATSAA